MKKQEIKETEQTLPSIESLKATAYDINLEINRLTMIRQRLEAEIQRRLAEEQAQ